MARSASGSQPTAQEYSGQPSPYQPQQKCAPHQAHRPNAFVKQPRHVADGLTTKRLLESLRSQTDDSTTFTPTTNSTKNSPRVFQLSDHRISQCPYPRGPIDNREITTIIKLLLRRITKPTHHFYIYQFLEINRKIQ